MYIPQNTLFRWETYFFFRHIVEVENAVMKKRLVFIFGTVVRMVHICSIRASSMISTYANMQLMICIHGPRVTRP